MATVPKPPNFKVPPPVPKGPPRGGGKDTGKEEKEKNDKTKPAKKETEEREDRRERAIVELIETETTYCRLLDKLVKHYVIPLRDYKLLNEEQHKALFPQLEVIKQLSDTFLQDLTERRKSWDPNKSILSDLIEQFVPYFRMYQQLSKKKKKELE
ncbi:hypothetical protein RFI_29198 [Reticulomyxa filosa]|uniref:DH domain-containing protein n=1 Tax=Reticulomyxa filosa TaxID=46433 RepID=X6M2P9_RETFI|nr:hypothetical protein RFI_29198 [Reticulomyxa filosa]|eukprot:ETO08194.1 hypothetical protein RFI_29198 [Reticulomyxa filosa]